MMQGSGGSRSSQMPPQTQPHQPQQRTWERFCREEAREAASAFLERVRRFKSRHASARDVHDSTFTNEFSAAFLEESSVLMASEGETILPTTSAPFTTSLPADVSRGVGNARGRDTSRGTSRRKASKTGSGKSSWWSNLFKWKSKSRERSSSGSSTSSTAGAPGPSRLHGSTKQKKRRGIRVVKETAVVQLLNLSNESEGTEDANWNACKLTLVEQQENYQLEIYSPPRNPMPKMSLFCFLIEEVRSTSLLETPDSNSCFAVKSQSHGEYVFDVGTEEVKEEWVRLLQAYTRKTPVSNGHLPRSSEPSSHLATLPRTPSQHSSPARESHQVTSPSRGTSGGHLQASPLLNRRTCERPSNQAVGMPVGGARNDGEVERVRHLSVTDSRKVVLSNPAIVQGDSEESVLVDMSSFMRNYSQSRSPNRQRKTMSMFVDSSVQITSPPLHMNPYVQSTPPVNIVSPTSPSHERTEKPESPARFPYGSPRDSPPPPIPKRGSRPHSMFIKNAVNTNVVPPPRSGVMLQQCRPQKAVPARHDDSASSRLLPVPPASSEATPLPAAQTESRSLPTSPNEIAQPPATPTGSRPLPAIPNEAVPRQAMPRPLPAMPSEATPHPATPTGSRPHLLNETAPPSVKSKDNSILSGTPKLIPFSDSEKRNEHPLPKRKLSQPSLPSCPHVTSQNSTSACELQSPGNLRVMEDCSQSSSALHPVSIAALARPRKNSIPLTPTEDGSGLLPLGVNGVKKSGKERKRKTSAPMLPQGFSVLGEAQEKKVNPAVSMIGKRSESRGSVNLDILEADVEGDVDIELEKQIEGTVDDTTSSSKAKPLPQPQASLVTCGDISEGEKSSDHATLFFPYFSQRSSPSQHQASPGTHPTNNELGTDETQDEEPPPLPPPLSIDIINSMALSSNNQTANSSALDSTHTPPPNREEAVSRSSSHTNRSVHSISSLEDRDNNVRTESATSNPIFVETTEGQGYNQAAVHTRHPYEYWATNQQDVTNLRALSQFPWFHGMISRTNASQLVVAEGDRGTGQYLVRQSESREGDFVLTFNYHGRAKHLRMAVDESGCNIQHLWFESVPSMLEYFRTNSIPLESFWLNDDVKLTSYINRQASDAFRTTTVVNVDQLNRVPPRRSRSLHLGMSHAVANGSSHPTTPISMGGEQRGSSSTSASTNSLQNNSTASGWRQIFRSQRSSSAQNVGRIQRSHSHNAGSIQATGRGGGGVAAGGNRTMGQQHTNRENAYVWRNY